MNKRMRELAEQAELYAVSENSSMLFDVWKKRYTEKLAEMIVQECAERLNELGNSELGQGIKKHFGVE